MKGQQVSTALQEHGMLAVSGQRYRILWLICSLYASLEGQKKCNWAKEASDYRIGHISTVIAPGRYIYKDLYLLTIDENETDIESLTKRVEKVSRF